MFRDVAVGFLVAAAVVAPTGPVWCESTEAVAGDIPAGEYKLDPSHATLIFRVNHLGFSHFTSQFRKFDATLTLDPKHPERASVTATIDPRSIEIVDPKLAVDIQGAQWFDSAKFPLMTFRSTKIELTGANSARITGDLSLHGISMPVSWDATFNGGYASNPYDIKGSRIGFSAHGTLKRSAFGMGFGVPAPGTTMGVSDDVDFTIEAEFNRPIAKRAPVPQK
ncbi:MAG: polyisoprenoid-binding protein [Alphaproteobacteria bacterium]|nr:polyisoprenoid-binding protein [Alphaproteobacteria bacterium]